MELNKRLLDDFETEIGIEALEFEKICILTEKTEELGTSKTDAEVVNIISESDKSWKTLYQVER